METLAIIVIAGTMLGVIVGAAAVLIAVKLGILIGAHGADAVQPRKQLPKPFTPRSEER